MPHQRVFEGLRRRKSLRCLEPIQTQGFAIIPGILMPKEVDGLLDEFRRVDLPCSRAGVRYAMRLPKAQTGDIFTDEINPPANSKHEYWLQRLIFATESS
jgi:hypothetical protein